MLVRTEFDWLSPPRGVFRCRYDNEASGYLAGVMSRLPIRTWWDSEICRSWLVSQRSSETSAEIHILRQGYNFLYIWAVWRSVSFNKDTSIFLPPCFSLSHHFFVCEIRAKHHTSSVCVLIKRKILVFLQQITELGTSGWHESQWLFIVLLVLNGPDETPLHAPLIVWFTCLVGF